MKNLKQIPTVISFTTVELPYGWLGNMAPFPVEYGGEVWKTIEALFQALRYDRHDIRQIIRNEATPMSAKMKAKKLLHRPHRVVVPMSDQDVLNMRFCIALKFTQHPELARRLVATGPAVIVEDIGKRNGTNHFFWGAKVINGEWVGTNMVGKILMETRGRIAAGLAIPG